MALEYGTPNMPEMIDGKTRLGEAYFNPLNKRIDQRVSALEELKVSWQDATDLLTSQGLGRIDAVLGPAFEEIDQSLATLAIMLATAQTDLNAAAEGALEQIQPQIDAKLDAMDLAITALNAAVMAGNAAIASAVAAGNSSISTAVESAASATSAATTAASAATAAASGVAAAIASAIATTQAQARRQAIAFAIAL
ncbi:MULTISPECIES: hypothetical protein [unclassified Shinella]|uniref:hypothetical protein n=1 Tax=unclassified Shinella TaxID=2643062 RepID=UPI00234F2555|nr:MULTISPECIES: hypothetical protein [unclassified Shinella]MCO5153386.1 hypothetical protein [Shinella sp.]MDC7260565.1 hypothetical protein [Shinella sp. HY16]MDC7267460.1 hypothetical protein [Shinella sp. YZ44]